MSEDNVQTRLPTAEDARIESLDVLRGFALLGILVMNIQSFGMPSAAYTFPNLYGSMEGLNGLTWYVGHLFFDLKFMAMFSMLFGAGIVLMSQRRDAEGRPSFGLHYRRMCWLLLFGLVHAYMIWQGDILVPYALTGMVVYWLRQWAPGAQVLLGVLLLMISAAFQTMVGVMDMASIGMLDQFTESMGMTSAEIEFELAAFRGGYLEQMPVRAQQALGFQLFIFPIMLFWRVAGLMLLGMALFKWSVLSGSRSSRFYVGMAAVCAFVGLSLVAMGAWYVTARDFAFGAVLGFGGFPNWFGSVVVALMWIALVMLLCRADGFHRIKQSLAAYGRMAFTNYIGQSVLATLFFYGHGLGYFGYLSRVQLVGVVVVIWAIQIPLSILWLKRFKMGPLEWLWRSGVYMRLQPMRR